MDQTVGSPPARPATSYVGSILVLVLGIGLAVGVSALFGALGWGGELASQTAGAASGAAPLIIDGVRRRPARTSPATPTTAPTTTPTATPTGSLAQPAPSAPVAPRRIRALRPRLLVAGLFGFAVVLVDNLVATLVVNLTRLTVWSMGADPGTFMKAYTVLGGILVLPVVLAIAFFLAVAAGHRLGANRKRWLLFGIGVFTVVRVGMIAAVGVDNVGVSPAMLVAGILVTIPLLIGVAFLGAGRARRTQPVFDATSYFRRLPEEDQVAVLGLLDEAVAEQRARRRRVGAPPQPSSQPPSQPPSQPSAPPAEWDGPH